MPEFQAVQSTDKNTRIQIMLSALLTPLIGGAIIYYSLRKSHPAYAKLGNLFSFIGLIPWIGFYYGLIAWDLPLGMIGNPLMTIGLILSIFTVRQIQKKDG